MFFLFRFTFFIPFLFSVPVVPSPFFTFFLIVLLYFLFHLPLNISLSLILFFLIIVSVHPLTCTSVPTKL